MDANERFEYMAAKFYKETKIMAPGKDDCLMSHTYEERQKAWSEWAEKFYSELFDSQLSSKWISVDDDLPECATWVLIFASTEDSIKVVTMAFYEDNEEGMYWLCHNDNNKNDQWEDVTHWMPLPDPPK